MHKEVREILTQLERLGFRLVGATGSGHWLIEHPNGRMVLPASPSEYRWRNNAIAQAESIAGTRFARSHSGKHRNRITSPRLRIERSEWEQRAGQQTNDLLHTWATTADLWDEAVASGDKAGVLSLAPKLAAVEDALRKRYQPCPNGAWRITELISQAITR